MQSVWKAGRCAILVVGALLLTAWGVALIMGVASGSIDSLRAVFKLMMVIGLMIWIGERLLALAKN